MGTFFAEVFKGTEAVKSCTEIDLTLPVVNKPVEEHKLILLRTE